LALSAINIIPIIRWLISFFVFVYMWVMSLLNALNNKQKSTPILGKKNEERL